MPEIPPPTLRLRRAVLITDGPMFTHASLTAVEFFTQVKPRGIRMRQMMWAALQLIGPV